MAIFPKRTFRLSWSVDRANRFIGLAEGRDPAAGHDEPNASNRFVPTKKPALPPAFLTRRYATKI